ncbi:MAG TPA: phosphatase PAP2 family protein [Casimicrobiaceae bacterium]
MEAHLQSLIDYFAAHPLLALGLVFAGSFLESLAVVGTIAPGSSIVFAGGVLVGLGALDPWQTAAVAIAGAILGDGSSYWLGRHYHDALCSRWPLRKYPALLERGRVYFAAHGGKSVFLGRFFGPVRAIVPIVAGMSSMPAGHFYAMNVASAFAWAAAHLVPGALFGASLEIAGAVSSRLVVLLALLLAASWAIAAIVRFAFRWGLPRFRRLRERIFLHAGAASGPLARVVLPLLDPARREPMALLVSATLLVAGAWLFLGVVEDVVTSDTLVDVDRGLYEWLQALRTGWGDDAMVTVSGLGSAYVMIPLVAVIALWLAITRRWQSLAYWVSAVVFAELFVVALKYALGRARPETPYAAVDEYSLPSGHAALSLVVYGFLAFLLGHGKPRWEQTALASGAAGVALLMGFSRLYLGAHWFSDVIASYGLGIAWIALLSIAYIHHVRDRPMRTAPVLLIVVATLTFVGGSYAGNHHARDLARYAKSETIRTLGLDAWQGGGWRSIAAARTEISGESEEPFSVQWMGSRESIAGALASAGWQAPAGWKSAAALLWLLPSTPIGELPVLPKLHQGQPPALTLIRPADPRTRDVIRLWRVAAVAGDGEAAPALPLWAGMITTERARSELGLIETARTASVFVAPERALAQAVQGMHVALVTRRANGQKVLLVW